MNYYEETFWSNFIFVILSVAFFSHPTILCITWKILQSIYDTGGSGRSAYQYDNEETYFLRSNIFNLNLYVALFCNLTIFWLIQTTREILQPIFDG